MGSTPRATHCLGLKVGSTPRATHVEEAEPVDGSTPWAACRGSREFRWAMSPGAAKFYVDCLGFKAKEGYDDGAGTTTKTSEKLQLYICPLEHQLQ